MTFLPLFAELVIVVTHADLVPGAELVSMPPLGEGQSRERVHAIKD